MSKIIADTFEQIKGPGKPQKPTVGFKEQVDPVKTVKEAWEQLLGAKNSENDVVPSVHKPIGARADDETNKEIGEIKEFLEGEKKTQVKPKGNIEVLSVPPVKNNKPPPPEKLTNKLPELAPTSFKPARGNLFGLGKNKKKSPPLRSIEQQRKTQQ